VTVLDFNVLISATVSCGQTSVGSQSILQSVMSLAIRFVIVKFLDGTSQPFSPLTRPSAVGPSSFTQLLRRKQFFLAGV